MPRLVTHLDTRSDAYLDNAAHMRELVGGLRERLSRARAGGGPEAVDRHRSRGKLLARERIERLIDPGAAFLELSALAAEGLYDGDAPAAGRATPNATTPAASCSPASGSSCSSMLTRHFSSSRRSRRTARRSP